MCLWGWPVEPAQNFVVRSTVIAYADFNMLCHCVATKHLPNCGRCTNFHDTGYCVRNRMFVCVPGVATYFPGLAPSQCGKSDGVQ